MTSNYEVLSTGEAYKILAKDVLGNLKALVTSRIRRDRQQVRKEYDLGVWKSALDLKQWLLCKNLREYVTGTEQQVWVSKVGNRLVRIKACDYYVYRTQRLQEVIQQYAGHEPEVIELGCGCGYNLFALALMNHWPRLGGFDISPHALEAAREAAQHFGIANVSFGTLDLTNGDDPSFQAIGDKTVFTYLCLEQLKYHTPAVVENLLRAGVRRVIHIETTHELLRLLSLKDWATYLYVLRMDYQDNLLKTLKAFEKRGVLRIVDVKRLYYSPVHRNDPTLICWEPVV